MSKNEPSTRDMLEQAAAHVAKRDNVAPRVAKATVHAMPWDDLLAIVGWSGRERASL